ncbi:amidohydrolase [Arachidicoccus ginsenosidimutans]|uniref:amidohydrolase family protein n=1 Tax=Arachidicoccus sp. BS20 TaxID=1850526 RepID=UPI0007F094A0|nr:amidohydrolase family protein [Arachidicoccus sp. BS20]ANI88189.1 amidohydrolase [Arachidicoccus sp. BS20]
MQKIDAHNHFWVYDKVRDAWITDDMRVIQRDFLPQDFEPVLQENNIDGTVAVQADQSEKETNFLLQLAKENDFIKGVVGWVDLKNENIEERLIHYSTEKKLKGFRHILQGENVEEYLNNKDFLNGISLLGKYHFAYDILVYHHQLKFVNDFVERFPHQRFVIDHLAKPDIKNHSIDDWKKEISAIAKNENMYCKISGMVTEADWKNLKREDLKPYLDIVVENFGTDKIMFGSDYPVCLVATSYNNWLNILKDYFTNFSSGEKEKIFGGNAIEFYNL